MARILMLETYDTGSHAVWMRGYQRYSQHQVELLTLPGQWWQWRMQGGAVTLARRFRETCADQPLPDLIIASDMVDLTTFLSLTRPHTAHIPALMYFHENQITYPPGPRIKRDLKIGFINYASALAADAVYFNSAFHRRDFLDELPRLLRHYPDYNELETVEHIAAKSATLPLGVDLRALDAHRADKITDRPVLLWNHRWEYDKNPDAFAHALINLVDHGLNFSVILLGERGGHSAHRFDSLAETLGARLLYSGYAPDFGAYARLVWQANIAVSCAWQDFFGISMCEAIYCGCLPLMPRRLNYPDLIPAPYHDMCLYDEGGLAAAIRHVGVPSAPPALREYVSQFDWAHLAAVYDRVWGEWLR